MRQLTDILIDVTILQMKGSLDTVVGNLHFDSRNVEDGDLFVAVRGVATDGHLYIKQSIAQGAVAIVCEELPDELVAGVVYLVVENSAESLGVIAHNFYRQPSRSEEHTSELQSR